MTLGFAFTRDGNEPYAYAKDIQFKLPPGMIGNPQSFPRCTVDQLGNDARDSECPFDSQVGMSVVRVLLPTPRSSSSRSTTWSRREEATSSPASASSPWPARVHQRPGRPHRLLHRRHGRRRHLGGRADRSDHDALGGAGATSMTKTGSPPRGEQRTKALPAGGQRPSPRLPSSPTRPTAPCSAKSRSRVQLPAAGQPRDEKRPLPRDHRLRQTRLRTDLHARFRPTPKPPRPTGIDAMLTIPQDETPDGLATSTLKSAGSRLPAGFSINPAAGDGLAGLQRRAGRLSAKTNLPTAPTRRRSATIEIDVPALEDTLNGSVYQRTPDPGTCSASGSSPTNRACT